MPLPEILGLRMRLCGGEPVFNNLFLSFLFASSSFRSLSSAEIKQSRQLTSKIQGVLSCSDLARNAVLQKRSHHLSPGEINLRTLSSSRRLSERWPNVMRYSCGRQSFSSPLLLLTVAEFVVNDGFLFLTQNFFGFFFLIHTKFEGMPTLCKDFCRRYFVRSLLSVCFVLS